jgi:predicted TPR repeat methyltransferase
MSDTFERARDLFLEGVQSFESGRFEAAVQQFEASLALMPGRASTLANLGATRVRLGHFEQALDALGQALAQDPDDLDAWAHQAVALAALGRHEDALASFERVLAGDPRRAGAWYRRGLSFSALQRHQEALQAFEQAVAVDAAHGEAWFHRGQTLQLLDRHGEALPIYEKAVAIEPAQPQAWSNLGGLLKDLGRTTEAAHAYEQALAHGADADVHRYFLASVSNEPAPGVAPRPYVELLFDDYADKFEHHLVGVLNYRAHQLLVDGLMPLATRRWASALDLGCGTGLCGTLLKPLVVELDGVDLSRNMLDKAAALGIYRHLEHGDVVDYLQGTPRRYALLVAADVFIYLGDLGPVFAGASRVLEPGGVFCFSVEALDESSEGAQGYALRRSLRYAHGEHHVRTLAARHGFEVLSLQRQPIREDQRQPIPGLYVWLQRVCAGRRRMSVASRPLKPPPSPCAAPAAR